MHVRSDFISKWSNIREYFIFIIKLHIMTVSKFGTSEGDLASNHDSLLIGGLSSKATKIQNGTINNFVTIKNNDGEIEDSGISKSSILTFPIINDINVGGKKITNIENGSSNDAVNKQYVDTKITTELTNTTPVILQSTIARIVTKNGSSQIFRSNMIHNIFRNNSKANIIMSATTSSKSNSGMKYTIIPKITFFEIIDDYLWYECYIYNGNNSPWPQEVRFDVIIQVLAFKQRTAFRSSDAPEVPTTEPDTQEIPIDVETDVQTENDEAEASPISRTGSQRSSTRTNIANSYV